MDVQLFVNVRDMFTDGMHAEVILIGYFFVAKPIYQRKKDLFFAGGQLVVFLSCARFNLDNYFCIIAVYQKFR